MEIRSTYLHVPRPFSLKATALGHGWHECSPLSWSEAGQCLQVIERKGNMPIRLSLTSTAPSARRRTSSRTRQEGEAPRPASFARGKVRVNLTLEADELSDETMALIRRRAGVMLRADLDLTGFCEVAGEHAKLPTALAIGAGRFLRSASMTENIIKTVCGTNVNWAQAVKMINRIGQLGPALPHFRSLNAWPTPREILNAGEDYLLNVARVGYRADSILKLCRSIVDGEFDPEDLDTLAQTASTQELYERLLSIRGIGPTSANYLLTFLGRFDRMAIDSWTLTYAGRTYFKGRKPTVKQVEAVYARFGDWKQLVWWYEQWLEWGTAKSMLNGGG